MLLYKISKSIQLLRHISNVNSLYAREQYQYYIAEYTLVYISQYVILLNYN